MNFENPIEQIMSSAMSKLRGLVDVNTVVGSPLVHENTTIIPLSKVSMGFIAGGGEYGETPALKKEIDHPFAGGSGAGLCVSPIGFLVINGSKVKVINMEEKSAYAHFIESIPGVLKTMIEEKLFTGGKDEKNN